MALSDILKKQSEGIMFPFKSSVESTSTTQDVYDSTTDGITTIEGRPYTGPSATVQYGTAEQGYPRMLREIEQGELPQFRQEDFPKIGEGVMTPSTPVTQPVDTTPTPEVAQPSYDPCPAGYQLVNGVCQPIQQDRGRDRPTYTGPEISDAGVIEGYTSVLGRYEPDALNATRMLEIENKYGEEFAKKVGEINQKYRNRGVQISEEGLLPNDPEIKRLQNVYGQQRVDEDYTLAKDGKYYRVIATSPTLGELATDMGIAMGEILQNFNTINLINTVLGKRELTKDEVATDSTLVKLGIQKPSKLLKYTNRREYNKQLREYNIDKLKTANAVNYYGNSEEVTNEIANRIKQAEAEKPDRPAQNLQEAQKEADRQSRASGFKNQKDQARARARQATAAQKGLGPQTTSEGRAFGRI